MGSLMGLIGSVIVVIAVLAQCSAAETTYIVGDSAGWTLPFNTSWATGKTFAIGDKLSFTFNAQAHDVAQVTKTEYDGCTSSSNSNVSTTSPTVITLSTAGEHYYICTFTGHCAGGQKLSVNVVSSTTESPGPSPPPTAGSTPPTASSPTAGSTPPTASSPTAGSTPPSPSSAPSRAAAFGGAGAFMAVLTALFV
eukprot:TRINITY_DN900_c1_g1_i2.p1 TRINITY_DN900_c1_g1~~TRINITY_DN900_c1_g1_i2.p1  ORF type:complete len:195 (+),score=20.73 TRINITY_DN900_c1_g1_i2:110-694(+)